MICDVIIQTLLFMPLTMSIYISYRILRRTDLTVEGSYILGAGVFAMMLQNGLIYPICLLLGIISGAICGLAVAYIQKGIPSLLASIIMLFFLSGFTIQVMGTPNISLLKFAITPNRIFFITALLCLMFIYLMRSDLGLRLRALGSNENLLEKLGYNKNGLIYFGLMISNAIAAVTGIMNAQYNGYADIYMGQGLALTAVGLVTIGMQRNFNLKFDFTLLALNTFIYTFISNILLYIGINILNLKIILALFLIYFLKQRGQNAVY